MESNGGESFQMQIRFTDASNMVYWLQIHERAFCTMNEKFSILQEAKREFQMRVFENKHELNDL